MCVCVCVCVCVHRHGYNLKLLLISGVNPDLGMQGVESKNVKPQQYIDKIKDSDCENSTHAQHSRTQQVSSMSKVLLWN